MESAAKSSYVYTWTRPDTGDIFYVGMGRGRRDVTPKYSNKLFMRIIEKLLGLGLEPAVARIAEDLTIQEARLIERAEIARIGRKNLGRGPLANLTDGGEGTLGYAHNEEARAKISATHAGRPKSAEHNAKVSAALKGKTLSPERRASVSAAQRGRKHSQEHVDKRSAALRGKKKSLKHIGKTNAAKRNKGPRNGGFKGVYKNRNNWTAQASIDGVVKYLGLFRSPLEAAHAFDAAAFNAYGHSCYLNFPECFGQPANDNTLAGGFVKAA